MGSTGFEKTGELFGIDLRSLALFRIGLGVLILWDLAVRATALRAHYSDVGVLPRSMLIEEYPRQLYLSLHMLSGEPVFQIFLFVFAGISACALVIGFYTKVATVLSWGLMLSLHVRNPAILNSGDTIFLLLLFWGMFLPLGAHFSFDGSQSRDTGQSPRRIVSAASLGLLLQICFIYWFSVVWKSAPEWHADGTAVYYALSLDRFATSFGHWLLSLPSEFLNVLTKSTIWIELFGPIIAFSPVLTGPLRLAVVGVFVAFHAGLSFAMTLGIFPAVCIVAWLVFLPSWFWDTFLTKLGRIWDFGFSRTDDSSFSQKTAFQSSLAVNMVAILLIWYIGTYNLYTLSTSDSPLDSYFSRITPVGETLNLDQTWRMFAPRPSTSDGWYVTVGTLCNGDRVDVFANGRKVTWERPELISATYKNQRWRKYLGERLHERRESFGPLFVSYLWQDWNERKPTEHQLCHLEVYRMHERNLLNNEATPIERQLVARMEAGQIVSIPRSDTSR